MPGSRERARFGFAVSYHRSDNQVWIVERRTAGMGQYVSQFASFVNRAGSFRRAVAADAPRKGKLLKELVQACFVFAFFRIDFGVRTLKICRSQNARRAVSRARHEDHVEVEFLDQPVQVDIDESQTWARAPMPEQAVLDVLWLQRFLQQGIRLKIDHAQRQIAAGAPVCVSFSQFL